jgi:LysM repeat protein
MKRLLLASILICSLPLLAQEPGSPASAAARQQESVERFSRIEADLEALKADNLSLRDEVAKFKQELSRVRDEQGKTAIAVANSNPHEDLKRLAEKINEVDRKRETDKQTISEEIKRSIGKLENAIAAEARPVTHRERAPTPPPAVDSSDTGFSYTVASGDSLGAIVKAYNQEFKKKGLKPITFSQVKAANPNVNWDKLKVGTKIVIPAPAGSTND